MKTIASFKDYVQIKEALTADMEGGANPSIGDDEVFELLSDLMREVWIDDSNLVMDFLQKLEESNPGKYASKIKQIKNKKSGIYGDGLDKPTDDSDDFHHDVIKPVADRAGDSEEGGGGGGGG